MVKVAKKVNNNNYFTNGVVFFLLEQISCTNEFAVRFSHNKYTCQIRSVWYSSSCHYSRASQ
jgi:hypothetical protein